MSFCFLSGRKCASAIGALFSISAVRAFFSISVYSFIDGESFLCDLIFSSLSPCIISHYWLQDSLKWQCRLLLFINSMYAVCIFFNIYLEHSWIFLVSSQLCGATVPKEQQNWVILSCFTCTRCSFLSVNADHVQQFKTFFFNGVVILTLLNLWFIIQVITDGFVLFN